MSGGEAYRISDYAVREVDLYAAEKFRTLLRHAESDRPWRVLNVGCGSGEANLWLLQAGHVVDACDPDETAVAMSASLKAKHGLSRLSLRRCALEELEAPEVPYDCVFMLDVLEHLEDDESAVRRIYALLKPGGLVCISVPAMPSLFGHHDVMLGHYRRYTRRTLRRLLNPWFEPLLLRSFGFFLVPVAYAVSRVLGRHYPIDMSGRSRPIKSALATLLSLESRVAFPVGTSLLFVGRRRATG